MAGYYKFTKSNNAINAENKNRYPASSVAKILGVTTETVKKFMVPAESHHTSSYYNKTDYYDIDIFYNPQDYPHEEISKFNNLVEKMKLFKTKKATTTYDNCEVSFPVWIRRARYSPLIKTEKLSNVKVTISKNTIKIHKSIDDIITKRTTARGLKVYHGNEYIINNTIKDKR